MTAAVTRRRRDQCDIAVAVKSWPVKSPVVRHELMWRGICPDCGEDAARFKCEACGWEWERPRGSKVS